MKKYNDIDSVNDRTRLILLKYKQGKDAYDNRQLKTLEAFYADNGLYESAIVDHLMADGCVTIENASTEGYKDEFGRTKPEWAKLPHGFITTRQGLSVIPALKRNSEKSKRWQCKALTIFQLIGITIAAIGGLLKIAETIYPAIFQ